MSFESTASISAEFPTMEGVGQVEFFMQHPRVIHCKLFATCLLVQYLQTAQ